jgi:hypothetical protein
MLYPIDFVVKHPGHQPESMRALGRLAHRCTRIERLVWRPILIQTHLERA